MDELSIHADADDNDGGLAATTATTTNTNPTPGAAYIENKPNWEIDEEHDTSIEIEEELPIDNLMQSINRPSVTNSSNDQPRQQQIHGISSNNNNMSDQDMINHANTSQQHSNTADNNDSYNTAAESRRNSQQQHQHHQQQQQQQQQTIGSKPKLTNMSLLSSAVAHATMERCLLGVNGGETVAETVMATDTDDKHTINYSKQCKPGHIIDILELRRLSSRGVPDEPPSEVHHRSRAASAPASSAPGGGGSNNVPPPPFSPSPSTNTNHHRSYRPLVWRVLLGYLPPQTDMWNTVLSRDRKLYDTLVQELFSNTCPHPHDVFDEKELREQREEREENSRLRENEVFRIRSSDDSDDEGERPSTPTRSTITNASTTVSNAVPTTPVTQGLMPARMQQEWVRGENELNNDSIFGQQNNNGCVSPGSNAARLSPMCAMNTPRTRIRKEAFKRRGEALVEEEEEAGLKNNEKNDEDTLSSGMQESLLLPDDDDNDNNSNDDDNDNEGEGSEEMDTIDVEGGDNEKEKEEERVSFPNTVPPPPLPKTTPTPDSSPSVTLARSISITKTCSEEGYHSEGVELCRQSSRSDNSSDDSDDEKAIPPQPEDSQPDTDEEENILLLDEIRKDVIRTHPDLAFFLEPKEDLGQKRYAALERILFVWAKLNKGVRYVQGMNEIVGTLYFVLAHDSNEDWGNNSEADTYFLFNSLMVEMRDVFVPDLDEADTGIHGRISNMITLLSLHDPETRCHLDSVGIDPSFYSVRWLTTLLSREFLLPDTIRLWDSMFASTHNDNFLRYVSV